jgi:hypothetical protein
MIVLIILLLPFLIAFIYGVLSGIKNCIPITDEVEEIDESKESEISMIECNIYRRQQAALILEYELEKDIEPLKRARLLNQLNTLDKQTFKDYKRIESIKDG